MLETTIKRLSRLFPEAEIRVFSDVPEEFPDYHPNVQPLDSIGRQIWYRDGFLIGRLAKIIPSKRLVHVWQGEHYLRRNYPRLCARLIRRKLRMIGYPPDEFDRFFNAICQADLVVANGMGGITDTFPKYALELLDTMGTAQHLGSITAMLGQGIGPLNDPNLRKIASEVLSKINLITLREKKAGLPVLKELGISSQNIYTTGDDAIEMAYEERSHQIGGNLGINLRASGYSGIDGGLISTLKSILQTTAKELDASLTPVPISKVSGEEDLITIYRLLEGYDRIEDLEDELASPIDVIRHIKSCRVVITGSYHAAVFALSLGIPAIGVAKSSYYKDKFQGLADQFGSGMSVVLLDDSRMETTLPEAIKETWGRVESYRETLWGAAEEQIENGKSAYELLRSIVVGNEANQRLLRRRNWNAYGIR